MSCEICDKAVNPEWQACKAGACSCECHIDEIIIARDRYKAALEEIYSYVQGGLSDFGVTGRQGVIMQYAWEALHPHDKGPEAKE